MGGASLWSMAPHTRAKHALLKYYLDRWFPILSNDNTRLNYLDGFAGPGEYATGEQGSPLLAINSALALRNSKRIGEHVEISFFFIERDSAHADNLKRCLEAMTLPKEFHVEVVVGEFHTHAHEALDVFERENKNLAPTFAFVDPFGFRGVPMSLMARILKYPKCEVLINLMIDPINRWINHHYEAVVAHIPQTFGTDEVFQVIQHAGDRKANLLALYERQLAKFASHVRKFTMRNRRDQALYSLFFASNHPLGFVKMKEAMWSVDRETGSAFSDADKNAPGLFEAAPQEPLWDVLLKKYCGQTIPIRAIEIFVDEQSDYTKSHIRNIFIQQELHGRIRVHWVGESKRRPTTFPNGKARIEFLT